MRTNGILPAAAVVAMLAIAGCAAEPEPADTTSPETAAPEAPQSEPPLEPSDDASDAADDDHDDQEVPTDGLELTTSSGTTALTPTEVYCSGHPGELRHLIGKTNHQLPLVKITPGEFAMVKLGDGRPYKSTSPSGVTVGDESVTFDATALGDATLTGTIVCTDWED